MKVFKKLSVSIQIRCLLKVLPMSKSNEKVYYAVGRGKEIGIYNSWRECKIQTDGVKNAKFRKFYSLEEANEFINFWRNYSSGVKECDVSKNLVSNVSPWKGFPVGGRRNGCSSYREKKSVISSDSTQFRKTKNNFILGNQSNEEDCRNELTSHATPYISPLSSISLDFMALKDNARNNKKLRNPHEGFIFRTPSKSADKCNQGNSETVSSSHPVDIVSLKKENSENFCNYNRSSPSSSNSTVPSTAALDVPSDALSQQNKILLSDPPNKSLKSNDSCPVIPDDDTVSIVIKKEVVDVDVINKNKNLSENGSAQNREEKSEISDKLISCLKVLETALTGIMNQNSAESEKVKSSLKTLLERIITSTNNNVNPQMEPEGNVDKNYEETKKGEIQPVESASSPDQSSSQIICNPSGCPSGHSVILHSASNEGRVEQKNVDVLALNLRLDSFEKRFDVFLKEIGAIASEISHIKAQIKELKENSKSASAFGSLHSPGKEDGMSLSALNSTSDFANTTSWFHSTQKNTADSVTDFDQSKRPTLKRKLSTSDASDSSKRFADDGGEIDYLLSKIKTESVDYTSFTVDKDDYVEVYTDGAAKSNGLDCASAGIGIWFGDNHPMNVAEAVVGKPTNNTAEIQAARVAIQLAIKAGINKLKIFTDSEFLINCATKWINRWKRNGWTLSTGGPVKNRKELEKLDKAASKISVRWEKVMGHAGIKGNETADRLANEGARKFKT